MVSRWPVTADGFQWTQAVGWVGAPSAVRDFAGRRSFDSVTVFGHDRHSLPFGARKLGRGVASHGRDDACDLVREPAVARGEFCAVAVQIEMELNHVSSPMLNSPLQGMG